MPEMDRWTNQSHDRLCLVQLTSNPLGETSSGEDSHSVKRTGREERGAARHRSSSRTVSSKDRAGEETVAAEDGGDEADKDDIFRPVGLRI